MPEIDPADDSQRDRLVPIDDLATRRALWHGVWAKIIANCERLASEREQAAANEPPAEAERRAARRL